jgi:hypothetical protein
MEEEVLSNGCFDSSVERKQEEISTLYGTG